MYIPRRTFPQLQRDKEVIENNEHFESSLQGFYMNIFDSFRSGIISQDEKRQLMGLPVHN